MNNEVKVQKTEMRPNGWVYLFLVYCRLPCFNINFIMDFLCFVSAMCCMYMSIMHKYHRVVSISPFLTDSTEVIIPFIWKFLQKYVAWVQRGFFLQFQKHKKPWTLVMFSLLS
jgi:hypothetical protein